MSIQNGIVKAPVSNWDVRRALHENTLNIGRLCTSPKINPWAKYKPCAAPGIKTLTEAQRKAYSYGMTNIPYFRYGRGMVDFVNKGTPAPDNGVKPEYFTNDVPVAYRQPDFDGYYRDAPPPVSEPPIDSITPSNADTTVLAFPTNPRGPEVLDLSDLTLNRSGQSIDLDTHYFGAVVGEKVITQSQPVSQYSGSSLYIPTTDLETQTGKDIIVCAFLSPEIRTTLSQPDTAPNNAYFIPLTWTKKKLHVNYRPAVISGSVSGWYNSTSDKYISVAYSLKNESTSSAYVSGIQITVYGVGGTALRSMTVSNLTIGAGRTVTNTVQILCAPLSAKYVSITYTVAGTSHRLSGAVSQGAPRE